MGHAIGSGSRLVGRDDPGLQQPGADRLGRRRYAGTHATKNIGNRAFGDDQAEQFASDA